MIILVHHSNSHLCTERVACHDQVWCKHNSRPYTQLVQNPPSLLIPIQRLLNRPQQIKIKPHGHDHKNQQTCLAYNINWKKKISIDVFIKIVVTWNWDKWFHAHHEDSDVYAIWFTELPALPSFVVRVKIHRIEDEEVSKDLIRMQHELRFREDQYQCGELQHHADVLTRT